MASVTAQEWLEGASCNSDDILAFDLKLIQDPGLYTGLLELPDCANYCEKKRDELGLRSVATCCLQARYYYSLYQIWAADCALVDADLTQDQEEDWDEGSQVFTTYYSYIAQPNAEFSTTANSTLPSDAVLPDIAYPVGWREDSKWGDGLFCNVADPMTDYLIKTDSDSS